MPSDPQYTATPAQPADCWLPTDVILLRLRGHPDAVDAFARQLPDSPVCRQLNGTVLRHAWRDGVGMDYVYLGLPHRVALSMALLAPLAASGSDGVQATVCRLAAMHRIAGASHGREASFHYAVETTPEAGWELELQQWYDGEHLPGLAGVPGCVQAQRFWNHDDGPRSFACYDLVDPQTLESPAWLAVRHTPWSSRVRPHFTGTLRTMFTLRR